MQLNNGACLAVYPVHAVYAESSPDPNGPIDRAVLTHTRTGWIGQPPVLDRHEVVTIGGDVVFAGTVLSRP